MTLTFDLKVAPSVQSINYSKDFRRPKYQNYC